MIDFVLVVCDLNDLADLYLFTGFLLNILHSVVGKSSELVSPSTVTSSRVTVLASGFHPSALGVSVETMGSATGCPSIRPN